MKTLTTLTFTALAACGGAQNKPIDSKTLTICAQTQAAICSSEGLQFPYEEGKDCANTVSVTMKAEETTTELSFCRTPEESIKSPVCKEVNRLIGLDLSSHFNLKDKCETKTPQKSSP